MYERWSLKPKLSLSFLVIGLVPFIIASLVSLRYYTQNLEQQVKSQLLSIRDSKQIQLENYFKAKEKQIQFFVGDVIAADMSEFNTPLVHYLLRFQENVNALAPTIEESQRLLQNFFIEGSEDQISTLNKKRVFYDNTHAELHPGLKAFIQNFDFSDLFLVNRDGYIVYSVKKRRDFGKNLLLDQSLSQSGLQTAFLNALANKNIELDQQPSKRALVFTDFLNDKAFLSVPLYEIGEFQGAFIVELSKTAIDAIVNTTSGLGDSGRAFLVGSDKRLRSTLSKSDTKKVTPINEYLPVDSAMSLKRDSILVEDMWGKTVLTAYTPLNLFNTTWALIVEIEADEAFSEVKQWQNSIYLIALLFIAVIALFGYWIAQTIAKPVRELTQQAEALTGDVVENYSGESVHGDEISRLSSSYRSMYEAIQSKINHIEQQNKELLLLDKFKNDLLANTTHELKTPLSGIIGLAESLFDKVDRPYQRTLKNIIYSGQRLSTLVNDILDAAKLKQRNIKLNKRPMNLRQLVDFELSMSADAISKKGLQGVNKVPEKLTVFADQQRLQQILQNLIGNAIKFTEHGEITICAEQQNDRVCVQVIDTGVGIAEVDQKRIFETFEQAYAGIDRSYGGTGLGLAITRELVALHEGEISVSSGSQGSCFTFDLAFTSETPINLEETIDAIVDFKAVENAPQTLPVNEKYFTVLAVDDEPINLEIIRSQLEDNSMHIVCAQSGPEALTFVAGEKPDLILLDVMMPEMDGFSVCKKLRMQYSSYDLPIIFLTARNQLNDLVKGFSVGANDYLAKPFYKDELLARVNSQLELNIHRNRMGRLVKFFSQLGSYKSHEEIVDASFSMLESDPYISTAASFQEGKLIRAKNREENSLLNLPEELDQENEVLIESNERKKHFAKLSNLYSLAATYKDGSSGDWFRNVIKHAHTSIRAIKRISANPENALIQSQIIPALKEIICINVEKNYCILHKEVDGKIKEELVRVPFKQVLFCLEKDQIFQVHRSFAVNPQKIIKVSPAKLEVSLTCELKIPMAKKYLNELKKELPLLF